MCPPPESQAILDTALRDAPADAQERCAQRLAAPAEGAAAVPGDVRTDDWEEDLDRVVGLLARQDFAVAEPILERWVGAAEPRGSERHALLLYGCTMALLGDAQGQQGRPAGVVSACYRYAHRLFRDLHLPRRTAQSCN